MGYVVFGEEYQSREDACRLLNISERGVELALSTGVSVDEAFEEAKTSPVFYVKGVDYVTVENASMYFRVDVDRVRVGLLDGLSNDAAIDCVIKEGMKR